MNGELPLQTWFLHALEKRGRLRVAQGRFEEGIADLNECGRRSWTVGNRSIADTWWRSSMVPALMTLGRPDEARELADEELNLARAYDGPHGIARSLLGEPKVVILDEPTAALGVAQTAEVLALITRLKERGYGVIVISHNLADVFEVADRIVVLRLGRNAGMFDGHKDSSEDVVAAITGASDSAALERERARIGKTHAEGEAQP